MFEAFMLFMIWWGVGYVYAMLTVLALNGAWMKCDWLGALLVALLGPIQAVIFMRLTDEVN